MKQETVVGIRSQDASKLSVWLTEGSHGGCGSKRVLQSELC